MSKPLPPLQVPFTIPQYISYFPYTSNVVLNQLLEQFNHEFHQMIEICETENSIETWNVFHAYFLNKIDVINHHLAIVSNDPNDDSLDLFDENISPRTTARKVEQIKKEVQSESFPLPRKFKLRADAPPFIPTSVIANTTTSNSASIAIQKSNEAVISYSKIAQKHDVKKLEQKAPPAKSPLLLWNPSKLSPTRDEWDDDSLRDEMAKATEQVWLEAEAWLDEQMAAEEEEWRILELGINQVVGLADHRFSSRKEIDRKKYEDLVALEGLIIETAFDVPSAVESPTTGEQELFSTPYKPEEAGDGSPNSKFLNSSPPIRTLHQKLSSPDRKRALSPSEAKRRYEAKLQAAETNREKTVAEKVQKAMIASTRVKMISMKEAKRQAEAGEALQEKLNNAEQRHSERLNQIKGKAGSENAKVNGVTLTNAQNSETLALHLQHKFKEVEAKILAATQRREQRLEQISGSQKKKNSRKIQQMSEFRLQLEKQKMERWEKLQKRFEAVQERRKKRLEEMKRRAEAVESGNPLSIPNLSSLTLVDDTKLAKAIQTYSPKVISFSPAATTPHEGPLTVSSYQSQTALSTVNSEGKNGKVFLDGSGIEHVDSPEKAITTPSPAKSGALIADQVVTPETGTFDSLSFDPNEADRTQNSGIRAQRNKFHQSVLHSTMCSNLPIPSSAGLKALDYDINMSHSEEIELILFPAVAKAHAKYLEFIKRNKILQSRNETILSCLQCVECNPTNNVYYQNILPLIKEGGDAMSSPIKPSPSSYFSAFQHFVDNIEEVKKSINNEERGASSYNIYASIVKEVRIYGMNCNIDLAEKINFLISNLLDSWQGTMVNSVGIDDFVRSGGILLLPVLISYEFGILSDLSCVQNFINSLVIFARTGRNPVQIEGTTNGSVLDIRKDLGISPDAIPLNTYRQAVIQHLTHHLDSSSSNITAIASSSNKNELTPNMVISHHILQQHIDYCNIIDLFSLIICEYSVDISLLFSLSLPISLIDVCMYLHYLFAQAENDHQQLLSQHKGIAGSQVENFDGLAHASPQDVIYGYSMVIIRSKSGKLLQLFSKLIASASLALATGQLTNESVIQSSDDGKASVRENIQTEMSKDTGKENVPQKQNSRDESEAAPNRNRDNHDELPHTWKSVLSKALLTLQQHSFQCQLLNLVLDQAQLQLVQAQSSFERFRGVHITSLPSPSFRLQTYTYYEELPSRLEYFLSVLDYASAISSFLNLLHNRSDVFVDADGTADASGRGVTRHQLQVVYKHWLSQLRRNRVVGIVLEIFGFCYESLFFLLEQTKQSSSSTSPSSSIPTLMQEKCLSMKLLMKLITSCFKTLNDLVSLESDLIKQFSTGEKAQLIERTTDLFILIVFLLDKSKDIKDVLRLLPNSSHQHSSTISLQLKESYVQHEELFQKLLTFLHRLTIADTEIRKMIGENTERRNHQLQVSSNPPLNTMDSTPSRFTSNNTALASNSSKIIQLILVHGSTSNTTNQENLTSFESIDLAKAQLLRQKLCLLQMVCLLSTKYYKDTKLKSWLLSLLILSSVEKENNTLIIKHHKKDKLVLKFLQYYLSVENEGDLEKKVKSNKRRQEEKLLQLYEFIPASFIDTVKIIWLS